MEYITSESVCEASSPVVPGNKEELNGHPLISSSVTYVRTMAARDHASGELEALSSLLRRQQELVTQLRALILPSLTINGGSSSWTAELAVQLFDDVIGCNTTVVSRLLSLGAGGGPAAVELVVDDKSLVRKKLSSNIAAASGSREEKPVSKKRRRNDGKRSRSLVTNVPDYDGHQWRKYGQKNINGTQHVRSYYRCTYRERNCLATKTVQEQDQKGSNFSYDEETAKYTVVYYGHHTCKGDSITNVNVDVDLPQLANMDLDHGQSSGEEMARKTTENFQDQCDGDLDVPALLEVLDNSLLNWEIMEY